METTVIALWEAALAAMEDDEVFSLVKAEGLGELYASVAGEAEDRGYWDAPGEQWRKAAAEAEKKAAEIDRRKAMLGHSYPRRPRKSSPCGHNCGHNCEEKENIN